MKKVFTFVMAMFAFVAMNAQNCTITLEVHDVWGDGTGYQLLIDADNAGWSDTYGPDCGTTYSGWEYTIPASATMGSDGEPYCVVDGSESITIPAGTYSYLILNPSCTDYSTNYIASDQCDEVNASRTFEANKTYTFSIELSGNYDCTTITVADAGNVGVEEVSAEQVRIYPNPATDVLNVEGNGNIEVSNILGQVVMTDFVSGHTTLNVANLNNGVYFVRVNGQSMKFVKR